MRSLENELKKQGFSAVVGIDEAGRGSLAGPVVAAAVQILPGAFVNKIYDSKQLSPKKRVLAYEEILSTCLVSVAKASVREIEELNILQAALLAMRRAVQGLEIPADFCLVDGPQPIPGLQTAQRPVIKGDCLSISIAAAGIVAKVERDRCMDQYAKIYPAYNFGKNKGYATEEHRRAILTKGRSPIHRSTFRCAAL